MMQKEEAAVNEVVRRRALTGGDLTKVKVIGQPARSSTGRVVAVVQTCTQYRYRRRLWEFQAGAAGVALRTTAVGDSECNPVFAPQLELLAFASQRRNSWDVCIYDVGVGELVARADLGGEVRCLVWLDSETIVAAVDGARLSRQDSDPVRVKSLYYKEEGIRGCGDTSSELWEVSVDGSRRRVDSLNGRVSSLAVNEGVVAYVVDGIRGDTDTRAATVWCRDSRGGRGKVLWECEGAIEAISGGPTRGGFIVVASPSGEQAVFQRSVWSIARDASPVQIWQNADVSFEYGVVGDSHLVGGPRRVAYDSQNGRLVAAATLGEDVGLLSGDVRSHDEPKRLTPEGWSVADFEVGRDGRIVACLESASRPTELVVEDGGGLGTRRCGSSQRDWLPVSGLNTSLVRRRHLCEPEVVEVRAKDGLVLRGLLFRPAGRGPHPLLVSLHGGPHLCAGSAFNFETQFEVDAGYCVLVPNIRGSAGRGARFRGLSVGEWGAMDYEDVESFVDDTIKREGVNPDRLYLAGGSYGGYLVNWCLTRTRRYTAAVSERSISNVVSKFGTSDNGFTTNLLEFNGADIFGSGWLKLSERSPLYYVSKITTPMLLLHGDGDQRCPIEQSEQLFTALRRLGREVEFVRFPEGNHSFGRSGRPDHRIYRLEAIVDWLRVHGGSKLV